MRKKRKSWLSKRVSIFVICSLVCLSFAGCGASKNVSSTGGAICFGNEQSGLTEWSGYEAHHKLTDTIDIYYYMCEGKFEDCPHNAAGVLEENLTKFKKAKYYTLYLQTNIYMYYPCKGGYIEAYVDIGTDSLYTVASIVEIMYKDMSVMSLSNSVKSVSFEGKVELNTADWDFKVRKNEIIIPDLLRIRKDDGTKKMTGSTMLGEISVSTLHTDNYDYYKYGEYLIQAVTGTDVSGLITLK